MFSWLVRKFCSPLACTCVISAGVGPNVVCSRNRAATAAEICGVVLPTTCALMLLEFAEPGFGFATATATGPISAVVEVPVATICVPETEVTVNVVEPKVTVAPLTKFVPEIVSVKAPTGICAGETPVICGIGFHTATELDPVTLVFELSAAETVIVSGEGSVAGAVYTPLVEIAPTLAFPPATPLTDQVSVSFVIDGTNVCVDPTRTSAVVGESV